MSVTKTTGTPATGDRSSASSPAPTAAQPLALAQQIGNQKLLSLLRARMLQAKLTVSHPQDVFEREADRVAEQVMRSPDPVQAPRVTPVQAAAEDDERALRRSADSVAQVPTVDAATERSIQSLSGRGRPLPESVRTFMEPRFDADFSAVRVHDDAQAHELSRSVSAKAFTVGRNVVFGPGQYAPDTESGKQLLAHELTHTIQQGAASSLLARAPDPRRTLPPTKPKYRDFAVPGYAPVHLGGSASQLAEQGARLLLRHHVAPAQLSNFRLIVVADEKVHIYSVSSDASHPARPAISTTLLRTFDLTAQPPVRGVFMGGPRDQVTELGQDRSGKPGISWVGTWDAHARPWVRQWSTMSAAEEATLLGGNVVPVLIVPDAPDQASTTRNGGRGEGSGGKGGRNPATISVPASKGGAGERRRGVKGGKSTTANGKTAAEFRPTFHDDAFTGDVREDLHPATDGAFPSNIVATPALVPLRGSNNLTMHLGFEYTATNAVSQVWNASTRVHYRWERWNVSDVVRDLSQERVAKELRQLPLDAAAGIVDEWEKVDARQRAEKYDAEKRRSEEIIASGGTPGKPAEERSGEVTVERINHATRFVSALTSAGGHLVETLWHHATNREDSITRAWDSEGTYLIRCVAWPQEHGGRWYEPSVSTAFVEVRPADYIATSTLDTEDLQLNLWRLEREQSSNPRRRKELDQKIADLETAAYGSAVDALGVALKQKKAGLRSAKGRERQKLEKELASLSAQVDRAGKNEAGFTGADGKPAHAFRPRAAIVSKVGGRSFPLVLQLLPVFLGEASREWVLMDALDAPSEQGGFPRKHFGTGENDDKAIAAAFREFATHNGYGPGTIVMTLPASIPNLKVRELQEESVSVGDEVAKERLSDLVSVLTAASLFVPVAGEAAIYLGGALAYGNIASRVRSGTLALDSSLVSDVLAVLGAVGSAGGRVAGLVVKRAEDAYVIALETGDVDAIVRSWKTLKRGAFAARAAAIANDLALWGGVAVAEYHVITGLQAISQAERRGDMTHAGAASERAKLLLGALQSHALAFAGLLHRPGFQIEASSRGGGRTGAPVPPETRPPSEAPKQLPEGGAASQPGERAATDPVPELRGSTPSNDTVNGVIDSKRSARPRTKAAQVTTGPKVELHRQAPAVFFRTSDGIRLITVYNGRPYYLSLGISESSVPGEPTRKEVDAFYEFAGIQEIELIPPPPGEEVPLDYDKLSVGWFIKGKGITALDPVPELHNFTYSPEARETLTRPEEVNDWLAAHGAKPARDFAGDILGWKKSSQVDARDEHAGGAARGERTPADDFKDETPTQPGFKRKDTAAKQPGDRGEAASEPERTGRARNERTSMDRAGSGSGRPPAPDVVLPPLPRKGRKAPERLFELLERGGDRKLRPATGPGAVVNEPGARVFRRGLTKPRAAYDAYNKAIAESNGREVGIWYDLQTGEYAVMIGTEAFLNAPTASPYWIGLVHFHHNEFNAFALRLPSPRSDFADVIKRSRLEHGVVREFIEWNDPNGGRGRTEFGIDLSVPSAPFFVRIREPNGKVWEMRFKSMEAYFKWYDADTKFVEKDSPVHRYQLEPAREEAAGKAKEGAGSNQRTVLTPPETGDGVVREEIDARDTERTASPFGTHEAEQTGAPREAVPELTPEQLGADVISEQIGEYIIKGQRELKDGVLHRTIEDIDHIGGPTTETRPLLELIDLLLAEARAAHAKRIRISGKMIDNPNVRKIDLLAKRFRGSARLLGDQNIEIEAPVPDDSAK